MIRIQQENPIPVGLLDPLIKASQAEGHQFLERLKREYQDGTNAFQKPGEAFFFAYEDDRLIGTAGLNLDPFENDPSIGRLRRVYVLPGHRNRGIARQLVQTVLAYNTFPIVHLRSTPEANRLYESLGFQPTGQENPTHRLETHSNRCPSCT